MNRKWNTELDEYLKEIVVNRSNKEIAELINSKYKTTFTQSAINTRKKRLGIVSNYKYKPKYTEEIIEYLINNHKRKSNIELAEELSNKFNIVCDNDSISNLKSKLKKNKGIIFEPARNDGCIKKGNVPMNKGKKWNDYLSKEKQEKCRKTTYKKGNKPSNAVNLGAEHMRYSGSKPNDLGYLYVKVCDGKGNKNWKPKQQVIYEKHYGPIPPSYKVIFADGNRFNFNLDNLILVSNSEELIMNRNHFMFDDQKLTKTAFNVARVLDKANKLKNERL
jgi:hypothetical protein